MNWKAILIYGAYLSLAQIVVGFAAGFFGARPLFSPWDFAAFVIGTVLFAHLAIRVRLRPLTHALLVLAFYGGTSLVIAAFALSFVGSLPHVLLIGLEWFSLVASMAIGLTIGIKMRPARRSPGEA